MDGSFRTVLVTENVMWPNSITLDLVQERLYWVDAKLHLIGSIGLDGTRPNIISEPSGALHHPVSASILEDWIYWTEWKQNGSGIYKANKFDGSDLTKVTEASLHLKPMSVAVWHSYRQPSAPSLCRGRALPCSHLCVPSPHLPHTAGSPSQAPTSTCLCPDTMTLEKDEATCIPKNPLATPIKADDKVESAEQTEIELQAKEPKNPAQGLDEEVARLKMEQQQRNLYTGLVIGLVTGIGILSLLVGLWGWRRWSKGSQESLSREPRKPAAGRGVYTAPRSHALHISESESTVPLRATPESDLEPA